MANDLESNSNTELDIERISVELRVLEYVVGKVMTEIETYGHIPDSIILGYGTFLALYEQSFSLDMPSDISMSFDKYSYLIIDLKSLAELTIRIEIDPSYEYRLELGKPKFMKVVKFAEELKTINDLYKNPDLD